jgi:hypothetical protein
MSVKTDAIALALVAAALVGAAWYLKKKAGDAWAAVPSVVRDGADAAWTLGGAVVQAVTDPADMFGVSPGFWPGTNAGDAPIPKWEPTAPHLNPDDTVSNGSGGMNYNLF